MHAVTSSSSTRTSSARTINSMATSTDRTQPLNALTPTPPPQPAAPAPAPNRTTPAPKVGLAWRIFSGIALVVVVVLAVTLFVASSVASKAADDSIRVGLEQTGQRVSEILADQREKMTRLAL